MFEVVCHWKPAQRNAVAACASYVDSGRLPPVGTRVVITGTLVTDDSHAQWIEIHPVSSIVVRESPEPHSL